jgi:hypothetical protein
LRAESLESAWLFETDTDYLFRVSARRPHPGFNYFSTRPQAFFLFILVVFVIIAESNLILHAPQQYQRKRLELCVETVTVGAATYYLNSSSDWLTGS